MESQLNSNHQMPNTGDTDGDLRPPASNQERRKSSYFDAKNQKSLRHYLTREALPKESQYRDLSAIVGGTGRPTLDDLHEHTYREAEKGADVEEASGGEQGVFKLGWFKGVTMSCLLNIWNVMLFLRLPWVIGEAGIIQGILIISLANSVTLITTLSMSAVATNGQIKGGGVYYMISRSLGPQFGASIGLVFTLAISIATAVHAIGFVSAVQGMFQGYLGITEIIPGLGGGANDIRVIGVITVILMLILAIVGMDWVVKAQFLLLFTILASQVDFVVGAFTGPISSEETAFGFVGPRSEVFVENLKAEYGYFDTKHSFFTIFAIFFPAVTGIEAGANISGDLKDPSTAIPKGTLLAVTITYTCYIVYALILGGTTVRHALGNETTYLEYANLSSVNIYENPTFNEELCPFDENGQNTCKFGSENDYNIMVITASWGPLIFIGCCAATLSSVIACSVGAPRMFQALAKDKLYPLIHFFAKGHGPNDNPVRGYVFVFFISFCFLMIGDLNTVSTLLTNFYLAAYCLINYSCFHASIVKSPGWRPNFKYYNCYVSLLGSCMCVAVMFLIDWATTLCTFIVLGALYFYVGYRKPDANWGSSTQAQTYVSALKSSLELVYVEDHVKNFRPQILLMSGNPGGRPSLVDFAYSLTKNVSMLTCANVVKGPINPKLLARMNNQAYSWMAKHNVQAFYQAVEANDLASGSNYLYQLCGLGKMRHNLVLLGYKSNWQTCDRSELKSYFSTLHKALDMHYAVGILRVPEGLDNSNILKQDDFYVSSLSNEVLTSALPYIDLPDSHQDDITSTPSSPVTPVKSKSKKSKTSFLKKPEPSEMFKGVGGKELSKEVLTNITRFRTKQTKGTIDVWWLYDDGGLTLLLPYILSTRSQWSSCKLRVFALANRKDELELEQRSMANLLNKFRIDFSDVIILPYVNKPAERPTRDAFANLINEFKTSSDEDEMDKIDQGILISEEELMNNKDKTNRHMRLREMLLDYSEESDLIVMTLPMPRKNSISATLYMAWLETLTKDMPPFLLVRGNQSSVLTFYS